MELDERFADKVAELCYKKYQSLPKKGKPQKNKEWTLLSCVVFTRTEVLLLSVHFNVFGTSKFSEYQQINVWAHFLVKIPFLLDEGWI